ncbi:MAG: hypothetical protein HZB16_14390 [Armatimonadetes bacterium]|nr:hypothetical protein [Armatimonadota bacterium]
MFGMAVAVALFATGCVLALAGQGLPRASPASAVARPGAHAPDLVATEHYVFVLAGPTLYQFEAGSLKLKNQIQIPPAKAPEVDRLGH